MIVLSITNYMKYCTSAEHYYGSLTFLKNGKEYTVTLFRNIDKEEWDYLAIKDHSLEPFHEGVRTHRFKSISQVIESAKNFLIERNIEGLINRIKFNDKFL